LFRRLRAFPQDRGLRDIAELNIERLRSFRSSWPDHNLSALKKLERFRAFFRFCQESKWIDDNPARLLKNPKITQPSTLSFSRDQVASIVSACLNYPDCSNALRVRGLVLLLRYSGLRIRDAVTLSRDRIHVGKIFLFTAKTGTPVWCPLPPFVEELCLSD
jgi:site-specific recombinase XerD